MKRQTSLYFIVVGAFLLFISGNFLSEGLSRVGMDNAVVSQRMSEGYEGFWMPSLSTPGHPDRIHYLPLGYWIESKWFDLFGNNSFFAEKVYSVLTYFILAALLIWIWTLIGNNRRTGWLPLMCFLTIPIISWSATNNLLESTMTMFILLSVAFLLKAGKSSFVAQTLLSQGKPSGHYRMGRTAWIALAALAMELAFMVKGFAGLFPIVIPFLYWLMVRRERILFPIFTTGLILVIWMTTLCLVILISPDVYHHLYDYIHHQIIYGIMHVQTVASRFYIIYVLLVQGIIPLSVMAIICLLRIKSRPFYRYMFWWRNKSKLTALQIERSKIGWFFLAVGFSGIIPIMLGHKQQEFYIVPTLPFFAIAMACLLYEMLVDWLEHMNKVAERVLVGLAILIFGSGLLLNFNSIHKINSSHTLLGDMRIILPYLEDGETVMVTPEVMQMDETAEYFYRYKKITFDTQPVYRHLITMYGTPHNLPSNVTYKDVKLPTGLYKLHERVEIEVAVQDSSLVADAVSDSVSVADSLSENPIEQ